MTHFYAVAAVVMLCLFAAPVIADDQADFNQRAAERDAATFRAMDRAGTGRITRADLLGNIEMIARFDDIDINRDGVIDAAEMERYIRLRYGVTLTIAVGPQSAAPSSNAPRTGERRRPAGATIDNTLASGEFI